MFDFSARFVTNRQMILRIEGAVLLSFSSVNRTEWEFCPSAGSFTCSDEPASKVEFIRIHENSWANSKNKNASGFLQVRIQRIYSNVWVNCKLMDGVIYSSMIYPPF